MKAVPDDEDIEQVRRDAGRYAQYAVTAFWALALAVMLIVWLAGR